MPTTAQQHKGKSISVLKKPRAVHVRKPLTVTLNDFPIVPKSVAKASSSRSTQLKNNTTTLDKMRHSSIVISENSDPNLRVPTMAPNATPACNNSLTLGKPPDPCVILPADLGEDDMRNKQGCYHPKFRTTVRQYLRDYKPTLIVFVEPRISGHRADGIITSLGFPYSHRVEVNGFSDDKWNGTSTLATIIYASPNATKRKTLWSGIRHLASSICSPWILFGDFNATLCSSDRMG
ncbi:hypothetical protein V6N13_013299 [Hibiscus sabdariffa]